MQKKAKVPTSPHDLADTYPASTCLQPTGSFFTENSGKSVSWFVSALQGESLLDPSGGVSVHDQGFFIIPTSTFLFLKVHLCTLFLIFLTTRT